MGYILDNQKHDGCFLCDAGKRNDDRKHYVLCRRPHSFIIMNLYPYNNGHLLVVPYSHVSDITALSPEELADVMLSTQRAVTVLKKDMSPEGFNIGINLGRAAGAGLPEHLHIQIVPRWNGDTSYISVFDETRVMPESLDRTYERLKPYFENLKD